jgi:predicted nucleic acid-binding protein
MRHVIVLDSSILGLLTNPKKTPEVISVTQWAVTMMSAGYRLVVPAIADYEVRRELERAGKTAGIARLDAFNAISKDRYLPLSDDALKLAAKLWAQARNQGTPTADPKELDCDVLIAVQALTMGLTESEFIIATTNVGHLSLFAPADLWSHIHL